MSFSWGDNINLTIYGESHGLGVGIIIDGLKAGTKLNYAFIDRELYRRKPNKVEGTTKRSEDDSYKILSGVFEGYTNGGPLNVFFRNKDAKSEVYDAIANKPRPSHADYPAKIKYNNYNDYRGGGFFSGRLTAPIVFAGAIAKDMLQKHEIEIYSHISEIGEVKDKSFNIDNTTYVTRKFFNDTTRIMIDAEKNELAKRLLANLEREGDSIGAKVECFALNLPVGLGNPFFNSIESDLASLLFSIPGVKAVEFGLGTKFSYYKGSEANDQYYNLNNKIRTNTNNNGGILGGLSNGMPIEFSVTFKPTASISKPQQTVNLETCENIKLEIDGRHDSCIAIRGRVVVEAVLAIVILNFMNK